MHKCWGFLVTQTSIDGRSSRGVLANMPSFSFRLAILYSFKRSKTVSKDAYEGYSFLSSVLNFYVVALYRLPW